jgi:alkanesulfonate monooxygenase SsuD/methylene tetrahydromethanopterin reductase-like flavin-dependent oxidoreductase (luciferase family)
MLEVMQLLWTGEPVQFHGEFYDFPELQMSPGLKSRLPVIIGGFSETALKRAARHDGWVGGQHEMDEVTSLVGALKQYRSDLGRNMDDFDIILALYQVNDETLGRCRELGVTRLYRDAFRDVDGKASCMSLDEKLRDMDAFANQYLV